jgi:glycosyltransferase involved in cell wall biosynthesis
MPAWMRTRFIQRTANLRHSDGVAARSAAAYLVNSGAVAQRVRSTYGIDPVVLPPARGLSPDGPRTPLFGVEPGYLLTISRPRAYKHTETICEAVSKMPGERLVVVGGAGPRRDEPGVTHLSGLSDAQMRWLYANAAGLVAVASEDFGLTPVEAQSFGVPAVVLRNGGYLDSMVENVTGVFVEDSTPEQIAGGIRALRARTWDRDALRQSGERYSPTAFARRIQDVVNEVLDPTYVVPMPAPARLSRIRLDRIDSAELSPEELTA